MSLVAARDRALELADQLRAMGLIEVRRFFGGAGLLMDGTQFGFVMKGSLYLRVDACSRLRFEALGAAQFTYAGRSRTVKVASYYEAPDAIVDDPDELRRWAIDAHRAASTARPASRRRRPRTHDQYFLDRRREDGASQSPTRAHSGGCYLPRETGSDGPIDWILDGGTGSALQSLRGSR
jgi:DNA transformation protein